MVFSRSWMITCSVLVLHQALIAKVTPSEGTSLSGATPYQEVFARDLAKDFVSKVQNKSVSQLLQSSELDRKSLKDLSEKIPASKSNAKFTDCNVTENKVTCSGVILIFYPEGFEINGRFFVMNPGLGTIKEHIEKALQWKDSTSNGFLRMLEWSVAGEQAHAGMGTVVSRAVDVAKQGRGFSAARLVVGESLYGAAKGVGWEAGQLWLSGTTPAAGTFSSGASMLVSGLTLTAMAAVAVGVSYLAYRALFSRTINIKGMACIPDSTCSAGCRTGKWSLVFTKKGSDQLLREPLSGFKGKIPKISNNFDRAIEAASQKTQHRYDSCDLSDAKKTENAIYVKGLLAELKNITENSSGWWESNRATVDGEIQ